MKKHYLYPVFATLLLFAIAALMFLWHSHYKPEGPASKPQIKNVAASKEVLPQQTITSIQKSIAKREYNISFDEQKKSLQSPNRKHNLRGYYKPGTFIVQNRIDSAGHNFELQLVNAGIFADGKKLYSAQDNAKNDLSENRLLIRHKGFSEEFINNEDGIRQNFIIDSAPAGTKDLSVKLSAKGMQVVDNGYNELQFSSNNNQEKLTYKDLQCWDANGKTLEASLRFENDLIAIHVNVSGAAYPVTIDPIVASGNPGNASAVLEPNQSGAQAGYAVSSAGDVNGDGYSDVIVGAPFYDKGESNEGAVFVYHGSATGIAANPALTLEGNQTEGQFGTSASTAGDINKDGFSDIIVGAPYYDKGQADEGAAMVYYGSAAGLGSNGTILEINQEKARFGRNVEGLGDVNGDGYSDVIVGAPLYDKGETDEGAAFIYHGTAQGIAVNAAATLEANQPGAAFGSSVAGAGDVNGDGYSDIIVGAILYDKGEVDEGVAFVYHGAAAGANTNAAAVLEVNQAKAAFGWSVASAGDVNGDGYSDIIIGAYVYDNGQVNEGAAFIYHGSAQGTGTVAARKLESNQAEARQGIAVACAGDVNGDGYSDVLIGVWQYDKGETNEGTVLLHHGSPTGTLATAASVIEGNQAHAAMGWAVKSAGDVNGDGYSDIIVGANTYDKGQVDEGAVFVWMGSAGAVSEIPTKLEGNKAFAQMGWSISDAGDVNGDGFDDLAIAANGYDNGQIGEGAVFIYHGSLSGLNASPITTIESNQVYASMGNVASAGDINGDGYGDIVIGVPLYGQANAGAVFIYYGSPQGIMINSKVKLEDQQGEDGHFGSSVASAGDVNGDGYADVIIGAPGFDATQLNLDEGMAFIYHGSSNGINANATTKIVGSSNGFYMGAVAGLGDMNGDGFGDIAVGSPFYTNGQDFEGGVFIHYGSATGINVNSNVILQAEKADCRLGGMVSNAGDLNGDGFMDLLVAASQYSNGQYHEGAVYVYYGSQGGINTLPTIIESNIENSSLGACSTAGDINGDGYSDVLISALGYSNGQPNEGAVFIYQGSSSGLNTTYSLKIEGNQESAFLGNSIAGVGDINGDGYSDIAMGAHQFDNGQTNEGVVFVYHGNSNAAGLRNNSRLYNTDLVTPINQTQLAKNNFGAGLFAKSFLGRSKGCLYWETKPKDQGFSKGSDNSITTSTQFSGKGSFADLGTMGTELKSLVNKQGPSTKVRVRVKYNPATALTGQVFGPWRYLPAYLTGSSIAPPPSDMSEKVQRKAEEAAGEKIVIYPNPVSDKLFIKTENAISSAKLLTTAGKTVLTTSENVIDVKSLPPGMYILFIVDVNGKQRSQKIFIKR